MTLNEPSAKLKKKVLSNVGMTEARLEEDIVLLRNWISKQPHLPQNQSDSLLKSFILSQKSVERAKERIDYFYTSRTHSRDVFKSLDPDTFEGTIQLFLMPGHTKEGERVFFVRVYAGIPLENFDHLSVIRRQVLLALKDVETDPYHTGVVGVYDMKGAVPSMLTKWNLSYHNQALDSMQGAMPIRIKKVYVINVLPFVVKTYNTLLKPFVKKKLADRITFLPMGDDEVLLTLLPKDCVPSDYGGSADSCQNIHDAWDKVLLRERDWCMSQCDLIANEALRPNESRTAKSSAFGVAGTFRSLAID